MIRIRSASARVGSVVVGAVAGVVLTPCPPLLHPVARRATATTGMNNRRTATSLTGPTPKMWCAIWVPAESRIGHTP